MPPNRGRGRLVCKLLLPEGHHQRAYQSNIMTATEKSSLRSNQFPVSVIMQRGAVEHRGWQSARWEAVGVVAGENIDQEMQRTLVWADQHNKQYLWSGFTLELFKDNAESYWYNLVSSQPSIFVVCRPEEDDEEEQIAPFLVTAAYDEADAYLETDDMVFAVTIPPEIHTWLERYVIENYVPRERKKRKRKNWTPD